MHLLNVQIKYGLNVIDPEDELQDFNLDKTMAMQNQLDNVAALMEK